MMRPRTYLAALTLGLSLIVSSGGSAGATLTYTLSPQGPIDPVPGSDVFFSLSTNVDLTNLDNLTADIVPSTFAEPGAQPGYSTVLPSSGFQDSFVLNFFGNELPAGQYNNIFDLLIIETAPVGSSLMLDFKTQATGPGGNGLTTDVVSNQVEIEVVPEPAALSLAIPGVLFAMTCIVVKRCFVWAD